MEHYSGSDTRQWGRPSGTDGPPRQASPTPRLVPSFLSFVALVMIAHHSGDVAGLKSDGRKMFL